MSGQTGTEASKCYRATIRARFSRAFSPPLQPFGLELAARTCIEARDVRYRYDYLQFTNPQIG